MKTWIAIFAFGLTLPAGAWGRGGMAEQGVPLATVQQEKRTEERRRGNRSPAAAESFAPEYMRSLVQSDPGWYSSPSVNGGKATPWRLMEPKEGAFSGTSGSNVPAWRRNIYFRDFHWLPP